MKQVEAIIKDSTAQWEENFDIEEGRDAKTVIQEIVEETILEEKPYTFESVMDDAARFMQYVRRQNSNAYGHRGIQVDFNKIVMAYERIKTGHYSPSFFKYVRYYVPDRNDMHRLKTLTRKDFTLMLSEWKEKRGER